MGNDRILASLVLRYFRSEDAKEVELTRLAIADMLKELGMKSEPLRTPTHTIVGRDHNKGERFYRSHYTLEEVHAYEVGIGDSDPNSDFVSIYCDDDDYYDVWGDGVE